MLKHTTALDRRPVNRITVKEIADVLRPVWTGPGHSVGSDLRGVLEGIFSAAKVEPNPAAWDKLKDDDFGLEASTVTAVHHPSLPYLELPSLMIELGPLPALPARALRFIILTGVREGEALGADWSEFDFAGKLWHVPAERMKMKLAHTVPLSDAAIACLGKPGKGYVFPSARAGHIQKHSVWRLLKSFNRIDPTQRKPITTHGMRATLSTWAEDTGFAPKVIDLVLAHKERNKVTAAYQRSEQMPERRKLLDAWALFATGNHNTEKSGTSA
jgi:integrase